MIKIFCGVEFECWSHKLFHRVFSACFTLFFQIFSAFFGFNLKQKRNHFIASSATLKIHQTHKTSQLVYVFISAIKTDDSQIECKQQRKIIHIFFSLINGGCIERNFFSFRINHKDERITMKIYFKSERKSFHVVFGFCERKKGAEMLQHFSSCYAAVWFRVFRFSFTITKPLCCLILFYSRLSRT